MFDKVELYQGKVYARTKDGNVYSLEVWHDGKPMMCLIGHSERNDIKLHVLDLIVGGTTKERDADDV